ncbi:MAG: YcxB family protein [Xanthomonadales bacterium]|nr:YcxB family protein [Xanthomonadales bacterium]
MIFNAAHQFLSFRMQGLYLFFSAIILFSAFKVGALAALVTAAIFYLAMWLLQLLFNVIYTYSARNKSLLTDHVIEIQEDALFEESAYSKSFHYWPGVAKVVDRPGYVAVYLTELTAHIVPKRAFRDRKQVEEFVALIKERLHSSHEKHAT